MNLDVKCGHDIKPLSFREIISNRRLNVVDGKIKWHIVNFTPDMEKYKVILAFEQAFKIWQKVFYPIEFEPTSNKAEAQVILQFDDGAGRFEPNVLAYAFAPANGRSNVWFNDKYNWGDMHDATHISLLKVAVHELGHSANLHHHNIKEGILFPMYQPNNDIIIVQDSINGIRHIYGKIMDALTPEEPDVPEIPDDKPKPDDVNQVIEFIKVLFPNKVRLRNLTEIQLLEIATKLDIMAKISDLKKDTIDKIYNVLYP